MAQLARENDAMVIAITSADTRWREATLSITLDVPEDTGYLYAHGFTSCSADGN